MKRILPIISVLLCQVAYADNWEVQIAESITHTYYISAPIKTEYIKRNGLWVKEIPKKRTKKSGYAMHLLKANCEKDMLGLSAHIEYSANGTPKTSFDSEYPQYQKVIPDSIGENFYNFICSINNQEDR